MNISAPFIKRPVGTSLLAAGLFLMGIVAYRFLPVAAIPRVDFPVISVSASLPGADPATVASSVAAPLERRLGQISGVTEMTSQSTLGGTSITLQFDLNRNVDRAAKARPIDPAVRQRVGGPACAQTRRTRRQAKTKWQSASSWPADRNPCPTRRTTCMACAAA